MLKNLSSYLSVLGNRNFFVLIATLFIGQIASAFLLLYLITAVFTKTGSNFGVSGVILSLSTPAFLLMTIAGLASDILDRRRIIIITNVFITLVVMAILVFRQDVVLLIALSFLYFAGNSFFYPAVTAASGQLLKKKQLVDGNSIFFTTLAGGQMLGLFFAAIVQFFFENLWLLLVCEFMLIVAALLPFFLPKLPPRRLALASVFITLLDIFRFFKYIFSAKTILFYFFIFASMQGVISFAATLAPGFFDKVVGLSVEKSPLLIFPPTVLGIVSGAFFSHFKKREGFLVVFGLLVIGLATAVLGFLAGIFNAQFHLIILSAVFLFFSAIGLISVMIASRTVIQKRIDHRYQGSVFGANFVLSSLIATLMSPLAAGLVALFGYASVLTVAGMFFIALSIFVSMMRRKWTF